MGLVSSMGNEVEADFADVVFVYSSLFLWRLRLSRFRLQPGLQEYVSYPRLPNPDFSSPRLRLSFAYVC
jgi:hypothetical protein